MSGETLCYIPLESPIKGGPLEYTDIQVSVYYYKDASPRGIVLSVNGCENRGGFIRETLTVSGKLSGIYRVIKPMERGNAKVLADVRRQIQDQIDSQSGEYWDEISKVVEAHTEPALAGA